MTIEFGEGEVGGEIYIRSRINLEISSNELNFLQKCTQSGEKRTTDSSAKITFDICDYNHTEKKITINYNQENHFH